MRLFITIAVLCLFVTFSGFSFAEEKWVEEWGQIKTIVDEVINGDNFPVYTDEDLTDGYVITQRSYEENNFFHSGNLINTWLKTKVGIRSLNDSDFWEKLLKGDINRISFVIYEKDQVDYIEIYAPILSGGLICYLKRKSNGELFVGDVYKDRYVIY